MLQGVYIASTGQYLKIGASGQIQDRVSNLQVGNAVRLRLRAYIPTKRPLLLEARIHSLLSQAGYKHRGEWYRLSLWELEWFLGQNQLKIRRIERPKKLKLPSRPYTSEPRLARILRSAL